MISRIHMTAILVAVALGLSACASGGDRSTTSASDKPYSAAEDTRIENRIRSRIYGDAMLADARINISVEARVVTITGTVPSRMEADRIERLVESMDDVRGVNIRLKETR